MTVKLINFGESCMGLIVVLNNPDARKYYST